MTDMIELSSPCSSSRSLSACLRERPRTQAKAKPWSATLSCVAPTRPGVHKRLQRLQQPHKAAHLTNQLANQPHNRPHLLLASSRPMATHVSSGSASSWRLRLKVAVDTASVTPWRSLRQAKRRPRHNTRWGAVSQCDSDEDTVGAAVCSTRQYNTASGDATTRPQSPHRSVVAGGMRAPASTACRSRKPSAAPPATPSAKESATDTRGSARASSAGGAAPAAGRMAWGGAGKGQHRLDAGAFGGALGRLTRPQ